MDNSELLDPSFEDNNSGSAGELPNATATLVLGILSLVMCFFYGFIGLILGVIAMSLHSGDKRLYQSNPAKYEGSFKNARAGYICALIGTCLSALFILFILLAFISGGFYSRF